ncbi:tRNA (guanine-N(7)-)-methyltransferase [Spiroplasma sp. TIUS-1]|uniref:tRNA (guanosine(46)-N7)-methyltransferase TrmB n=1 Tax=Spiroplasma sp. TIUS-1 TaxID=216963 RepID=UPI00139803D7|nr:tRNA (guanosine(46)-N7)-methyltransferase TrmB [Spiroplasma sp. TIUS-1]QHX35635.1 tRNA (guanine-N(7)-)-methyltransferase [Spiroplasma sp. TIUS-1]
MRLRHKNWTGRYIEANQEFFINNKFDNNFKNDKPINLEIGCGKGNFIKGKANQVKDENWIGMEKESTVIGVALRNVIESGEKENNILFINRYAENLLDIFEKGSISKIFLNFSDPWPKAKHAKKRLTNIKFLNNYWEVLNENGSIEIKTDNDKLYEYSLEQIAESKFTIVYSTTDLHKDSQEMQLNVMTEYEKRFSENGKNINKIIIKK